MMIDQVHSSKARHDIRTVHITPIMPAHAGNGLAMRTSMFTQAAASMGETLVLVVEAQSHGNTAYDVGDAKVEKISAENRLDTRLAMISNHAAPKDRPELLRQYGRPSRSIILSAPVVQEIIEHIQAHATDLIMISRSVFLPMIEELRTQFPDARIIVDLDDDDAAFHRVYADHLLRRGDTEKAEWHLGEADVIDQQIRNAEKAISCFTCASQTVTQSIQDWLGMNRLKVIENGVHIGESSARRTDKSSELLFVGNLSYQPNIDGLQWFLAQVWPLLKSARSDVRLCVAGSLPGKMIHDICNVPDVELVNTPSDLTPFYHRAAAAIVPLRFGSGSRIKILEAGSYAVPVVSTSLGAEGLNLTDGEHAYISAATPSEFAQLCLDCLDNPEEANRRALKLHSFVKQRHDRGSIIADIRSMLMGRDDC